MVGSFQESRLFRASRKSPFAGTKKHGFNQRFRKSRTIHSQEFLLFPRAECMDSLGKQFFPASCFSLDQDIHFFQGHLLGQLHRCLEEGAGADDVVKSVPRLRSIG